MKTEDYKRELLHIFFAQKRLIVGVTILVFLGALAIYLFAPVKYAAYGSVLLRGKPPVATPESLNEADVRAQPVRKEDLQSEVQLLRSTEVIGRTIRSLTPDRPMAEDALQERIQKIRKRLKAEVLPASNVIQMELHDSDAQRAVALLEGLMEQYLIFRMDVSQGRDVESFFGKQALSFKEKLESGETALERLYQTVGSADPDREIETLLLIKRDLELELSRLNSEAVEKRTNMAQLDHLLEDADNLKTPNLPDPVLQKLNERLIELNTERSGLLRTYLPTSQAVRKVESEMAEIHDLMREEMREFRQHEAASLAAVEEKLASVHERMAGIDKRNLELQSQKVAAQRLEREAKLQQQSYEAFSRRSQEARIQGAMQTNNLSSYVAVLNRAYPSDGRIFPKLILLPIGLIAGLLLGLSLGFSREYFDHSFKKPSDVDRVLDLPTVFSLGTLQSPDRTA